MAAAARKRAAGPGVRPAVVKVKIAIKELGLDDATYRSMLERLTGETSATRCSDTQLGVVLDELKAKGWTPRLAASNPGRPVAKARPAGSPMAKKARAMWISLHQLGVVRDPSETALEAFGRRQLHVDKLQWADESQAFRLIEALKAMAERSGWEQHLEARHRGREVLTLKRRLFVAQEKRLTAFDPSRMSEEDQAAFMEEVELADRIAENGRHLAAHIARSADGA